MGERGGKGAFPTPLGGGGGRGVVTRDVLEGDDVVAGVDGFDVEADGFDNAGAFVAEHDGEGAFGVFAREGVCVCEVVSAVARILSRQGAKGTCRCGRRRCSRFRCGLRALWGGPLRSTRWRDPGPLPRPRLPGWGEF